MKVQIVQSKLLVLYLQARRSKSDTYIDVISIARAIRIDFYYNNYKQIEEALSSSR